MKHINIEIKAKCFHPQKVEAFLLSAAANFVGLDQQRDTYFQVPNGRLKLRQGNIENKYLSGDPGLQNWHLRKVKMLPLFWGESILLLFQY